MTTTQTLIAVAAALGLAGVAQAQGTKDSSPPLTKDQQALLQRSNDLYAALSRLDRTAAGAVMTDDFLEIGTDGSMNSKADDLADMQRMAANGATLTLTFEQPRVRIHGDAGIVTGFVTFDFKNKTFAGKDSMAVTDVWVREQGTWRIASSQAVKVPSWVAHKPAPGDLKPVADKGCAQESSLRSSNSGDPAYLVFSNETAGEVKFYWINYQGKRDQERTLKAGESMPINTYLTHPFVVVDAKGTCRGIFMALPEPGVVAIKP